MSLCFRFPCIQIGVSFEVLFWEEEETLERQEVIYRENKPITGEQTREHTSLSLESSGHTRVQRDGYL